MLGTNLKNGMSPIAQTYVRVVIWNPGGKNMSKVKTSVALIAIAAGVASCGSTAAATPAKPTNTQSVDYNKPGPCNDLPKMLVPPKNGTPPTPTATSCWANGMYVGSGSMQSKQIIFDSKMADLLHYETTSAMFTNPKAWAAWNAEASKYADSKVVTGIGAQMAILLAKHQTFSLPPGNTVQNSGLAMTAPSECQSSAVVVKSEPSPEYLVTEQNVVEKNVTNGKTNSPSGSYTDVLANFNGTYKLLGTIYKGAVPPCVS